MGICPNCGDWVDEGDICMSCGGYASRDSEEETYYHSSSSRGYGGYTPYIDPIERDKRRIQSRKNSLDWKLKEARDQKNHDIRIKYYLKALEYADDYFEESERTGMTADGLSDRKSIFSKEDIDWISQQHYNEYGRLHILSIDQTENLEKLLNESGNAHKIRQNEMTRQKRHEEYLKEMKIQNVINLRKNYFKHIEKANELVLKDKPKKAMKEYRKALEDYEKYFKSDYGVDSQKNKMHDKKFTTEAVDNIMKLYIKTHPLLTSRQKHKEMNAEILEMLDGQWDSRVEEADKTVQEILHQKELEKEKRKEKITEFGADVIFGAKIAGDKLRERFKK